MEHPDSLVVWKLSRNSLVFYQKEIGSNRVGALVASWAYVRSKNSSVHKR